MTDEHIVYGIKPLVPISTESVGIQFFNHLKKNPDKVAFNDPVRNLLVTNKDVLRNSCILALKLQRCNLEEDSVIGLCIENEVEVVYIILASLYLGITVTSLNPRYTHREMMNCLNISKPIIVFCTQSASKILTKFPGAEKIVVLNSTEPTSHCETFESFVSFDASKSDVGKFQPVCVDVDEKIAFILYSSGTTGLPKGVCLSHKNINSVFAYSQDPRYSVRRVGTATIALLPYFHAAGLCIVLVALMESKEVIILRAFTPESYLKALQDNRIEAIEGTPTLAKFLARNPLVEQYKLHLKTFTSASACLNTKVAQELIKRLNLKYFWQGYGMTELTCRVTSSSIGNDKFGSCGQVHPYMSSKVIDVNTGKTLGPFQTGEVCFKGPQVMKGYKGNEAATRETIDSHNWLHTGDIGYYDDDGYLFIVDRLKELIKYKEFQVPPAELEAILLTHPKILDAAVVGIPDEDAGELPLAFVVKQPNELLTEAEVQEFVAGQVVSQKRLRGGVVFVKELPKTAVGKNSRPQLKSMLKSRL